MSVHNKKLSECSISIRNQENVQRIFYVIIVDEYLSRNFEEMLFNITWEEKIITCPHRVEETWIFRTINSMSKARQIYIWYYICISTVLHKFELKGTSLTRTHFPCLFFSNQFTKSKAFKLLNLKRLLSFNEYKNKNHY